jgi:hypothetical protein
MHSSPMDVIDAACLELSDRSSTDYAAVGDHAHVADTEAIAQPGNGWYEDRNYFYIGEGRTREPYNGERLNRLCLRINDDLPGNGNGAFTCRVRVWR